MHVTTSRHMTLQLLGLLALGASAIVPTGLAAETSAADAIAPADLNGYTPGRTLQDDLATVKVTLIEGYDTQRPRLLFRAKEVPTLREKIAAIRPAVWQAVQTQANGLAAYVPDAKKTVRGGDKYWRTEWILSGALSFALTGDKHHRDNALKWMTAYCREDTWGDGDWRPNVDLFACWPLYYIAVSYDLLHESMGEEERKIVRDGLTAHARAIFDSVKPPQQYRYDQNHSYMPVVALGAAALALAGEVPETGEWLKRAFAIMRRSRYVLGDDGYYYEGTSYSAYALHWHVRWADLLARATGLDFLNLPVLRKAHLPALHLSLPGSPGTWDIGDSGGKWTGVRPKEEKPMSIGWLAFLYGVAAAAKDGEAQLVANRLAEHSSEVADPASHFLWCDPHVPAASLGAVKPYYYFSDHGIVCWRSSWEKNATVYMFRCGPSQGHKAAAKLRQFDDWTMNSGHVHPDIGMFWMFARGEYLAVDTGYTQRKKTDDHNTLLVDGCGQGMDNSYWTERGLPYDKFNAARIEKIRLEDAYGYVCGEFGSVYHPAETVGKLTLRRHLVMTERFLLVLDEIASDKPHTYTWLQHADGQFTLGDRFVETTRGDARLRTYMLAPDNAAVKIAPTIAFRGKKPEQGKDEEVGQQLAFENPVKAADVQFLAVLVPLGKGEAAPTSVQAGKISADAVELEIQGPDGKAIRVTLDLRWNQAAAGKGPLEIVAK